jgi:putative hydrolase of the HAD superfamily
MIRNLIIDLGGVIVPLSIANTIKKLQALNIQENNYEKMPLFEKFEIGEITADEFLNTIKKKYPKFSIEQFLEAWNAMLLPVNKSKIDELKELQRHFNTYLLSNTNPIHIEHIYKQLNNDFELQNLNSLFTKVYLSYNYNMRKPNPAFFKLILAENNLNAAETLFIDDTKQHIDAADKLGLKTYLFQPQKDNLLTVINQFTQ